MPKGYRHVQYDERSRIHALRERCLLLGTIAAQLRRSESTVSRALRRNAGEDGYCHQGARRRDEERRRAPEAFGRGRDQLWDCTSECNRRAAKSMPLSANRAIPGIRPATDQGVPTPLIGPPPPCGREKGKQRG